MKLGRILAGILLVLLVAASPAAAGTVVMKSGPFMLDPFATVRPKLIVAAPQIDGYITRMHARLVDASGREVSVQRVMLHHVVFINQGRFPGDRQTQCGPRFGEPFYGTGEENETLRFPAAYGYRIRPGDRWKMQTMLMNHSFKRQRVWVEYTMSITRADKVPVTPYWVRVTNCHNDPSWSVPGGRPAGSYELRTHIWKVPATGLIIAAGSHLHGGAHDITLRQPSCHGRRLMHSPPLYGMPDDIMYKLKPVLHEPGPMNTGWFESARGIPIKKGDLLRATANYDAEKPHMGVMGVWHIYVAEQGAAASRARAASRCSPLPDDTKLLTTDMPHREAPPEFTIPLQHLVGTEPVTLDHPAGRLHWYASARDRPTVKLKDVAFDPVNMSIAAGTKVTWRFVDPFDHKVQLANGPRAMGSPTRAKGFSWRRTFTVPGIYQMFCPLHPVTMHQEITVRSPDDDTRPQP